MQAIEVIDHILHIGRILHTDQVVLPIRVAPAGLLRHRPRPPITPHLLQERQIQNLQVVNRQEIVAHPLQVKRQHQQRLSVRNSIWAIEFSKKE